MIRLHQTGGVVSASLPNEAESNEASESLRKRISSQAQRLKRDMKRSGVKIRSCTALDQLSVFHGFRNWADACNRRFNK